MSIKNLAAAAALTAITIAPAQAQTAPPPVYFVIYQKVTDQPRFDQYVAAVTPAIERRGGRLVAAGEPEVIEGRTEYRRVVVFVWPSREALIGFWQSEEYASIRKLREGTADWLASIVPSIQAKDPAQ